MFKIGFSRFLRIFAVAFELGLSYGVMVTRQILVLKFQVRILVAQPNGKPAVQQRVFCVFGGRPSRLGRGGFVRSFSEAPGFRFRGGEALDGSVFGADRTVCSVCGAGAFRRLRPCRALRLRGGGALDRSVLEAGPSMRFRFRGRPCHALRPRGGEASNGSVFGGSRLSLSVRRCFGRLVFGADRAVRSARGADRALRSVCGAEVLPAAPPVPCSEVAKRRAAGWPVVRRGRVSGRSALCGCGV